MTIEQATAYLNERLHLLNSSEIARRIKMDLPGFLRAVRGEPDALGRTVKIPKRCMPELVKIIRRLTPPAISE